LGGEVGVNILLVARWPVGGIRTHLAANHAPITEAGCRCTLVVPDDESLSPLREALPDGAPRFVPVPLRKRYCPLWRSALGQLASGRFDLVHAHGMTAAAHATLAGLASRVPLVVTLHEPLRDSQFTGIVGRLKRWALGRALARAAAIVSVSDDSRENLLRHFPILRRSQARLHTIPNGIDTTGYDEESRDDKLRQDLGLDDGTTLVGFLGRLMPEKGFPLLLDAIERLAATGGTRPFHVVAFGTSDFGREYQKRIDQHGLSRRVTLRGFVPDVRPVLRQLDLVLVPSLWEASSLVSMEAMSAGVPVLGSDCPGLREVLRGTPSRSFAAGDAASLETAFRAALADPWTGQARRFAPEARERFDNRRSAERLLGIYSMLGREARR
jgi:glycosyltransferase involved in cell wall biosynthesis